MTIPDPDKIVSRIDAMVHPAPEPENAVLTDETRVVRWTGPLFAVFSLILLPWTIYIAGSPCPPGRCLLTMTLPGRLRRAADADAGQHGLFRAPPVALSGDGGHCDGHAAGVDAWFDVLTTPGVQRIESIALAVFVELPLASVCIWLSWHAQQLEERRIVLLMRRYRGRLHRGGRRERA